MTKRKERENVFRMLFKAGFVPPEEMAESVDISLESMREEPDEEEFLFLHDSEPLDEAEEARIRAKVGAVVAMLDEIDAKIDRAATGWSVDRIGKAELAILRLAVYEMYHDDEVPFKVAINEAIELSKIYCGDEARSFVNGILGKIGELKDNLD